MRVPHQFKCDDIFVPISCDEPPSVFPRWDDHPVPLQGLPQSTAIPTNKFYANLFLGDRTEGVFCQPYHLAHCNFDTKLQTFGMSINHVAEHEKVLGPNSDATRVDWYHNPAKPAALNLSAHQLSRDAKMTLENPTTSSVTVCLHEQSDRTVRFPLVQGMGFMTAIYENLDPLITSGLTLRSTTTQPLMRGGIRIQKTRLTLSDSSVWLLYIFDTRVSPDLDLRVEQLDKCRIGVSSSFSGIVQVAKCPFPAYEQLYDRCAGAFTQNVRYSGSLSGKDGKYSFQFERGDRLTGVPLLMYALPHHVASFDESTLRGVQQYCQLESTTKGAMTAVIGNSWTMVEPECPTQLATDFMHSTPREISEKNRQKIMFAASVEVNHDILHATDCDSLYFSGKAMDKYANMCWAVSAYCDRELATLSLDKLVAAWDRFVSNKNSPIAPILYETKWKGLVYSPADSKEATSYNGHHLDSCFFVHAAAIIALLKAQRGDTTWIERNRQFVEILLRDVANPSSTDPFFPVFRSFDWFNGHSWTTGLVQSSNGKETGSTSEDLHLAYAAQLWGMVADTPALAARSTVMLAIMRRSLNTYFYMRGDSRHHPSPFAANRLAGIVFENKAEHATYFSTAIECIHGAHMQPATPASAYVRDRDWCEEEWTTWFSNGRVDAAPDGWRGVLYASLIAWDPQQAAEWFLSDDIDWKRLDVGMSLTYYRALAAEALSRLPVPNHT